MKQILILFVLFITSMGTICATTVNGNCGEKLTWSLNTSDSTLTISGNGEMTSAPWEDYKSQIDKVVFPDGLTSICNFAFGFCNQLRDVKIPNSVKSIGNQAFFYCFRVPTLEVPSSVNAIGSQAFWNLSNVVYAGEATGSPWGARSLNGYIEHPLVYNDVSKTTLTACMSDANGEISIPNSVTSIGDRAFFGCFDITSVIIPNSVISIGNMAFFYCPGIFSLNVPNSVIDISDHAFLYIANVEYSGSLNTSSWNARCVNGYIEGYLVYENSSKQSLRACYSLAKGEITIPNSVTRIENFAFMDCSALTSIEIPNSVISIGYEAFENCSSLATITIPNSVNNIEGHAFQGCSGMKSVTIPSSIKNLNVDTFADCNALESVTCLATTPPNMCVEYRSDGDGLNTHIVFYNVDCSKIPLYVPKESVDLYIAADQWKDFKQIIGIEVNTALPVTLNQLFETSKIIRDNQLFILRNGKTYTINGQEIE